MKIYVIYRKRTELEIDNLMSSENMGNRDRKDLKKEVYAFTASKKFANEFMRIHSDKYFEMKRKKYNDEEYCDFLEDYREKELNAVELSDRRNKIYVPMTEDEETEMDTTYYDDVLSTLPWLVEAVPSCRIFKRKYQKVLDLLGISKAVYKARIYNTSDDEMSSYDMEIDGYDSGECGYPSPGLSPNSINVYVSTFGKRLKERED